MKKFLLGFVALVLVAGLFSCGEKPGDVKVADIDDEAVYQEVLGEFAKAYADAKAAKSVAERFAKMAVAEAKMLEAGILLPFQSNGGNYAMSAVVPYTVSPVLWGMDMYRYQDILVANKVLKADDREHCKSLYAQYKGTGEYAAKAKEYLEGKGYTFKSTYGMQYTGDGETLDAFQTQNATDGEVLCLTYDGLIRYNGENVLEGALAAGLPTVSSDGLTYTFTLREGLVWVNREGSKVADLTADDFVAGFQHMLDDPNGNLSWLVDGVVDGVHEYLGGDHDMSKVGVKADGNKVVYTLEAPTSYFDTMFGYSVFAPLSRSFYESKGGKFGDAFDSTDKTYTYGTNPDNIAYCGPYILESHVNENSYVFKKNASYWDAANVTVDTITWWYNAGETDLDGYNLWKAGKIDGCGLNKAAKLQAEKDGYNDNIYISGTDATSFPAWVVPYRRGYANFNDANALVTQLTQSEADRTNKALSNQDFRLAICHSFDRKGYNAASTGEELALTAVTNSYTPGTFVSLPEAYTLKYNGKDYAYEAGTWYGHIMQDIISADGYKFKVFDDNADGGIGSGAQFDGWYNEAEAKARLDAACEALAADGVTVDAKHPIKIEIPYQNSAASTVAAWTAVKDGIEKASEGRIQVVLNGTADRKEYLYAAYYFEVGSEANYNVSYLSGWGPDYGDPASFLDTMINNGGTMVKCFGLNA